MESVLAYLLASKQHSQAHTTQHRRRLICPSSSPPQTFLRSLKPADLTLEEAGSRLRQALDRVSHTNDIRTPENYTDRVTANICQLVSLSGLYRCVCCVSPFCPLTCHTTLLPVTLLYSLLVGWFVSCYHTPLNTTLLLSALTIGICLVSHSLAGTFKSTPLSLFPYQTSTIKPLSITLRTESSIVHAYKCPQ